MAKHKLDWTNEKKERFIREGRGAGDGSEYKPWLRIQDFPSLGRVTRVLGWKTNRIHHLFTDMQTKYFYLLDWQEEIIDIKEHFPLFNVQDEIKNDDINFDLFKDKNTGVSYVLSTTFLISYKDADGNIKYSARSVKAKSELEKKLTLEKMEIERRYFQKKNIDWGIVTEKDIEEKKAKNIEWIHTSLRDYKERGLNNDDMDFLSTVLKLRLTNTNKVIREITANFDKENNLENGTGLYIFKYLIASKQIKVDMTKEIDINNTGIVLEIDNKKVKEGKIVCF